MPTNSFLLAPGGSSRTGGIPIYFLHSHVRNHHSRDRHALPVLGRGLSATGNPSIHTVAVWSHGRMRTSNLHARFTPNNFDPNA